MRLKGASWSGSHLIQKRQIYTTVTLPHFTISHQISFPVIPKLSHHHIYPEMPQVIPQATDQLESSPTILCLIPVWIQAKLPHKNQVQYYIRNCTLLSILYSLARLICRTPPYTIIHQSWHSHIQPLNPLRNDLSLYYFIMTIVTNPFLRITSIKHPPIHHPSNNLS